LRDNRQAKDVKMAKCHCGNEIQPASLYYAKKANFECPKCLSIYIDPETPALGHMYPLLDVSDEARDFTFFCIGIDDFGALIRNFKELATANGYLDSNGYVASAGGGLPYSQYIQYGEIGGGKYVLLVLWRAWEKMAVGRYLLNGISSEAQKALQCLPGTWPVTEYEGRHGFYWSLSDSKEVADDIVRRVLKHGKVQPQFDGETVTNSYGHTTAFLKRVNVCHAGKLLKQITLVITYGGVSPGEDIATQFHLAALNDLLLLRSPPKKDDTPA
jgi:hypothetical protein